VWIINWTTLLGIFCKISFTPTVTSCYHVHADAHLSAALLCYLGAIRAETSLLLTALNTPHPTTLHTRNSSCITLLWLHHNHKMSIRYHKNGLASSHQTVERWFIFMRFVIRIFWQNSLAINSLLVSVSRWNSWLEPFRFHVNCVHFVKLFWFMWGRHNCVQKIVFRFSCAVLWKLHG